MAEKYPIPTSFGTSTTVIVLPFLLGAPVGDPPSYGLASPAGAGPLHGNGFVGKSSPPVQSPAKANELLNNNPDINNKYFFIYCF